LNFAVEQVYNGSEALKKAYFKPLFTHHLDVMLPGMNGLKVVNPFERKTSKDPYLID